MSLYVRNPPPQGGGGRRSLTEGEESGHVCFVSSPSVAYGATYPWRGRIDWSTPDQLAQEA